MSLHSDMVEDVATCSNFKDVRTSNLHLDLEIDFQKKQISSWLDLTLKSQKDGLDLVLLDSHKTLKVLQVNEKESNQKLEFSQKPFASYGSTLAVKLTTAKQKGAEFTLEVQYEASTGPGVCWLDPVQTADKKHPFMYTQGQSVLNRSFFPCQDTPSIKARYSACVKCPPGLTAVMSANSSSFGQKKNRAGDDQCFFFEMSIPISGYLIALAVGDIQCLKVGPRSSVWGEPSIIRKAQAEFEGVVEEFLQTGENLFGPYVWGRYDILIMPPSFPYGGMENPCLTFVTPCIVVGDKSLTDVVIHEITHSWFGNLVTNANWGEFWLNEGFTMFGQRRIEECIYNKAWMCLEAHTGLALLKRHFEEEGDGPLTKLRVSLESGMDPDDTYNETPYEKGYMFVCYMRHLALREGEDNSVFDDFLKAYVQKFKFQSVVAEDLFDFYLEYFPHVKEQSLHEKQGFEFTKTWLLNPGWPPYTPDLSAGQELTSPVDNLVPFFTSSAQQGTFPAIETEWTTYQILHFLDSLAESSPLPAEGVKRLMMEYPFLLSSQNAEIRLRWCEIVIKNDIKTNFNDIRAFLTSQGKQKYTKPLYQHMVKGSEEVRTFACQVFSETKENLHENVREIIIKILQDAKLLN
ncbi:leukotriene a-4 hydrolase homolog [Plakobranchus ocellatus]|uniref:Leukotriene a-4 hydrolase homolog n=1 Tax=Plakobranchus ocellatus TaxID=259542 RepID=A0AAV3ZEH3_9GAST|nr:leukotriene a-4 hydrolase homolog [Plakobranchus ocellatus]